MENLGIDWGVIIQALFVAVLIPYVLRPLAQAASRYAEMKWAEFEANQPTYADIVEQAAAFAVKAAEQSGLTATGAEKKEKALQVAMAWLAIRGVKVDLGFLSDAIEAAVLEEFNWKRTQVSKHAE